MAIRLVVGRENVTARAHLRQKLDFFPGLGFLGSTRANRPESRMLMRSMIAASR